MREFLRFTFAIIKSAVKDYFEPLKWPLRWLKCVKARFEGSSRAMNGRGKEEGRKRKESLGH